MGPLLGCIGDDFTGSTDLANTLVRQGMRTIQLIGVPEDESVEMDADAVVIALKSRTIAAQKAVTESKRTLEWLKRRGCRQFFFKYCSTFDSTDAGNIGPVAEALLEALNSDFSIACPAFPETGRTVFKGHLFVGDVLLSESGMKNHPLTPMTDPNLVRVLGRQTKGPVGLVEYRIIRKGAAEIKRAFENLHSQGVRFAIVDALEEAHLFSIAEATADMRLVTGGSGIAMGLPENFRRKGLLQLQPDAAFLTEIKGKEAIVAGSCSDATRQQVAHLKETYPAFNLDILKLADNMAQAVDEVVRWALPGLDKGPVLVYTSDRPGAVRAIQEQLGRERAGELAETGLSEIARRMVDAGVRRMIVAGGETAGAVIKALKIKGLRIGPQIDPGVPWTASLDETPLALALKSGNFGQPDFFLKAFAKLDEASKRGIAE